MRKRQLEVCSMRICIDSSSVRPARSMTERCLVNSTLSTWLMVPRRKLPMSSPDLARFASSTDTTTRPRASRSWITASRLARSDIPRLSLPLLVAATYWKGMRVEFSIENGTVFSAGFSLFSSLYHFNLATGDADDLVDGGHAFFHLPEAVLEHRGHA